MQDEGATNAFREKASKLFPLSVYFMDEKQLQERQTQMHPPIEEKKDDEKDDEKDNEKDEKKD